MKILIITRSDDHNGIDIISEYIQNSGGTVIRFNTDCYPTEIMLDIFYGKHKTSRYSNEIKLYLNDQTINLDDITAVYYRRSAYGKNLPKSMNSQYRKVSINESRTLIEGLLTTLDSFHLDKYWSVRRACMKQLQLQIAESLGLIIPHTIFSNNPHTVREFAEFHNYNVITKMQTTFAIFDENGTENVVFTSKVNKDDIDHLEQLKLCPMIFQEMIPKNLELRATIVGNDIFCSSVDSQLFDNSKIDWRKDGNKLTNLWTPYNLPEDIKNKLLLLTQKLDLNYGAIDLILTPEGKYIFLEINPVGEYFWLDKQHNYEISRSIAKCLIDKNRRI